MNQEATRRLAREICAKKRTRREYVSMKRRFTLQSRQAAMSDSSSREATPDQSRFTGTPRTVSDCNPRQLDFTTQLMRLALLPSKARRYSLTLMMMAMAFYLLSGSAYNYVRNFIPLPSRQAISNRMNGLVRLNATLLQNLSAIRSVAEDVRERYEVGDQVIAGILAVDAISFQRELIITSNGVVQGSLDNNTVNAEILSNLHASFTEFEKFWAEHHKALISDAFVFQYQALNSTLKSFVVHICPTTQGKATERTIDLLEQIRLELMAANFSVIGYAMDGDSTYAKLHRQFYSEYSPSVRQDSDFANFSGISSLLVISDPLHILKRARYRLLGSVVHLGITNSSEIVDVNVLRELLSLPSMTFSNQPFTKMHDDLAVSLFSLSSLFELYEKKKEYVAYFLPFCLLNAAISEKDLTLDERINFLEVSLYYMMGYIEEVAVSPMKLQDRKSVGGSDVRLFTTNLAIEHCNTVASLLSVLDTFNGTVNLNRIGTNPLEHTFGAIRMRSRYRNTYDAMLRSVGAMETWKCLSASLGVGSKIAGRKTYYGQTIPVCVRPHRNVLPVGPRDVAVAHHVLFGLPISTRELDTWNLNYLAAHAALIVNNCRESFSAIYRRLHPQPRSVRLNSRTITVSSGSNTCMIKRERELNP